MIAAILLCLTPIAIDGDTIKCSTGEHVRIFGIQAPEKGEPGDASSTKSLQQLVKDGVACIHKGTSYERIVGLCMTADGVDVGEIQIRRGQAHEWCHYSKGKYDGC
jgi:endonuclease YncB( thermonuclease family)